MSPSTPRQTFRETVAQVAEKARATLPSAVNGRIESAVKLVLMHDVMPQADGSILVGSSSDPLQSYLLVGTACECQDFTRGQAPDGWCQHRIAAGIAKRVREVLPPEPASPSPAVEPAPALETVHGAQEPGQQALPEAPASCNVYLTISGHKVQVTLRDADEHRLLDRLQILLDRFPVPPPAPQAHTQPQGDGWCAVHQTALKLNHGKDGKTWLSHRTAEGQWCKGR